MFLCTDCGHKYKCKTSLLSHVKKKHPSKEYLTRERHCRGEGSHQCSLCQKKFFQKSTLRRHERIYHANSLDTQNSSQDTHANCSLCNFTSPTKSAVTEHYSTVHNVAIHYETADFKSFTEFLLWKEETEKETNSSFIRTSGAKRRSNGAKMYTYQCNRSGYYKAKGSGQRRTKLKGSCKINGFCPASLKVTLIGDEKCSVHYTLTHVGHRNEPSHLRIQNSDREALASKLAANVPPVAIIGEIRDSVTDSVDRLHLLTKKDLQNIERAYNLSNNVVKHEYDGTSVTAWVNQVQGSDSPCVLLFKTQGEEHPVLQVNDFVLVIMDYAQCSMLVKFGSDCVCMDVIHGVNNYGFELITLMVLDDMRQGFPCAFLVSNRTDEQVLAMFLQSVRNHAGTVKPNIFMTDMADAFYNVWVSVMGAPNRRLYCTWHVDEAWKKNLAKVKTKEKQEETYKLLRAILEEIDVDAFCMLLKASVKKMCEDDDTAAFGVYFSSHYVPCKEMWAYCYRVHCGLNTNMQLERMHKTLKYIYMQGKKVKRLDKSIHALMCFIRDKLFDWPRVVHKGKVTGKVTNLRKRHKDSLELQDTDVVPKEGFWQVVSSSAEVKNIYEVRRVKDHCQCKVNCAECNACIHLFTCSCLDSSIRWNMCKHIHLVCRVNSSARPASTREPPAEANQLIIDTSEDTGVVLQDFCTASTSRPSLEARKRALIEKISKDINFTETEEEISAVEKQLAPVRGIILARRKNRSPDMRMKLQLDDNALNKNSQLQALSIAASMALQNKCM